MRLAPCESKGERASVTNLFGNERGDTHSMGRWWGDRRSGINIIDFAPERVYCNPTRQGTYFLVSNSSGSAAPASSGSLKWKQLIVFLFFFSPVLYAFELQLDWHESCGFMCLILVNTNTRSVWCSLANSGTLQGASPALVRRHTGTLLLCCC